MWIENDINSWENSYILLTGIIMQIEKRYKLIRKRFQIDGITEWKSHTDLTYNVPRDLNFSTSLRMRDLLNPFGQS